MRNGAVDSDLFLSNFIITAICLSVLLLSSCTNDSDQTLRIAVASNAQFAAEAIKDAYGEQVSVEIELIVTSSGKLTAQIKHGAPYDIFLSADMKYPQSLYDAEKTLTKPRVYALGKLVLWTTQELSLTEGIASIQNPSIQSIAIANPSVAPYGEATVAALKKTGLYQAVKDKIVYGESISQVNQYLLGGAADVAFTAKAIVLSPDLQEKGHWVEVADSLYPSVKQGAVLLKHAKEGQLAEAKAFYQFLFSGKGKSIFREFGYKVP